MKKGVVIGIVLVSILFAVSLASAGEMTTEITGECVVYERGIEYERCCPMGAKINCVSCRDGDGGRDYYTKGETRIRHWNRFEMGSLSSGGTHSDECIEKSLPVQCYGTIVEDDSNNTIYKRCRRDEGTYFYDAGISRGDRIIVLREYYCERVGEYEQFRYEEYICPDGCVDGACVRNDGCPKVIGWKIEGIKCFVDKGALRQNSP